MNTQTTKNILYIVFGVLPATFYSVLLLFFTLISLVSLKIMIPLITLAALAGTTGLYRITFAETLNAKTSVMLLIPGQIVMASMFPWHDLFSNPTFTIKNLGFLADDVWPNIRGIALPIPLFNFQVSDSKSFR